MFPIGTALIKWSFFCRKPVLQNIKDKLNFYGPPDLPKWRAFNVRL